MSNYSENPIDGLVALEILQFCINSMWPSDDIWRHRTWSTLAQIMACCLTAPSHYLNQCWLIINKVQPHSSGNHFTKDTSAINHLNQFENYMFKFSFKFPRGQWVNPWWPHDTKWHPRSWSTLVQVMACHILSAKPLPEPMVTYRALRNKLQWIFNQNSFFFKKNKFKNIVCKLFAIFFRPQCVTPSGWSGEQSQKESPSIKSAAPYRKNFRN